MKIEVSRILNDLTMEQIRWTLKSIVVVLETFSIYFFDDSRIRFSLKPIISLKTFSIKLISISDNKRQIQIRFLFSVL